MTIATFNWARKKRGEVKAIPASEKRYAQQIIRHVHKVFGKQVVTSIVSLGDIDIKPMDLRDMNLQLPLIPGEWAITGETQPATVHRHLQKDIDRMFHHTVVKAPVEYGPPFWKLFGKRLAAFGMGFAKDRWVYRYVFVA